MNPKDLRHRLKLAEAKIRELEEKCKRLETERDCLNAQLQNELSTRRLELQQRMLQSTLSSSTAGPGLTDITKFF